MLKPRPAGFTLTELLVSLSVAAVLATLATPAFRDLRTRWGLRVGTSAVMMALAEARLAAISQGRDAAVCATANGSSCSASGTGVLVVESAADRPHVRRAAVLPPGFSVSANRVETRFHPWPRAASTVTWRICARDAPLSREVIVSQAGRPRVADGQPC